jgi:hypothetical protein
VSALEIARDLPIASANGCYTVTFTPTHAGKADLILLIDSTLIGYVVYCHLHFIVLMSYRRKQITVESVVDPTKCFLVSALAPSYAIGACMALSVQLAGNQVLTILIEF